MAHKVVIDTNVVASALMSRRGASYKLLSLIGSGQFEISLSVALVLEYEATCTKLMGSKILLSQREIDDILDYICLVGNHQEVYFLWRPYLTDIDDDMVLELAVNAGCQWIVTHNVSDFRGAERFTVNVITPRAFLEVIGAISK